VVGVIGHSVDAYNNPISKEFSPRRPNNKGQAGDLQISCGAFRVYASRAFGVFGFHAIYGLYDWKFFVVVTDVSRARRAILGK
jgi:hypothetical protein